MDFNADLGESWYQHRVGSDTGLMPFLDSCNIACGFHGGDALTMRRTIELALFHGVNVGAHPSYPDREHFGRRKMDIPPEQLEALLLYQVAALQGMTAAAGGELRHIKLHGALYHHAAFGADAMAAQSVVRVARALGKLTIYGPQGSHLEREALHAKVPFLAEGFVDRRYEAYNRLMPRKEKTALLQSAGECADQARDLINGTVQLASGQSATVAVQTICVHGDHRGCEERARAVREVLDRTAA
ncbi:5-oxoprolinase subunit PxpA [Neolewinella antarctica]|uniref:UPF0271 protein n=1 Tax=Neolewinella antarctica TaxID=442734 RepID=A0ABX0X5Y5_9BACT|nr:5-oxoprolinase subunit PxpA [Neolewinella antarctica]NJC24597.1 UPF0271 protein [Neolewinella antarctica]